MLNTLIVDDNKDPAQRLAVLLESQGHTVFAEYSAKRAMNRAHEDKLNVLPLDIGLPDIDGYELYKRLRLMPHLSSAVFVAVTGYGQGSDEDQANDAGFDQHFVKPVDLDQLIRLLATIYIEAWSFCFGQLVRVHTSVLPWSLLAGVQQERRSAITYRYRVWQEGCGK